MKRTWVEQVMGMPASVLLRAHSLDGPDGLDGLDGLDDVVSAGFDVLRDVDATFSTYRSDSEISRLRAGGTFDDVSPQVHEVLALCEQARRETDGWFDVNLPGGLDPSGLVKGWAVERALAVLCALTDVDICLNVGGDVAVRVRDEGQPFVAGIEDPHDRSQVVATVALTVGGLATSGTYARGPHILDPRSGAPATELASVSVIGPSLMWADVYATAAFARGRDGLAWLAELPSFEALVVSLDGTIETTAGWPADTEEGRGA